MYNGCGGSLEEKGTETDSRGEIFDDNQRKLEENEQSLEEESLSEKITSESTSPTTSENESTNPFVTLIDRQVGGSESEKQEKTVGETAGRNLHGYSNNAMGFQPDLITPGPNSICIPPDDFIRTLAGFNNMYLAHEISINPDYKLERFVPPTDSMESRIQQQMKRAFWDLLEEQLNADSPNYSQALSIFEEMKTMLLSLLMPHNHSMRKRINEVLDVDLIRQQVQNDALEFPKYAEFIVSILSQLCAPSRDEEILALQQLTQPVQIFKGILEVMEKMKLDMANFYVQQFRPAIVQNCLQYERKKFADFLDLEYRLEEDGLRCTRNWLIKNKAAGLDTSTIMCKSFSEILLGLNENQNWPETLALDADRLTKITGSVRRLGLVGGILLTSESLSQTIVARPTPELRSVLKGQLESLISDEDIAKNEKLKESLERVAEQVVKLVGEILQSQKNRCLEESEKDTIRLSINDLIREDHKIRNLLVRRTVEFAESTLLLGKNAQIPSGLNCINPEVSTVIRDFYRIVQYNRAVFDKVYVIILEDKTPLDEQKTWTGVESSLRNILKSLQITINLRLDIYLKFWC
ncbi:unnamed protein product [Allacma fusca]|uniref:T-complex protein 11 n=1 Tax=Allacma fusca TaxID=39272 RepID=A0A8J2NWF7_9HEXA|nr:unnamed protein product [Allacma fusca]